MSFAQKQLSAPDGSRIGYREAGLGQPLLLLHGIGSGSLSFEAELAALSQRFRVIAWDTPGYGGSDNLAEDARSTADYANRVAALMDALRIDRAHVLGHSLGGLITTALVADHPHRVDHVILSSPAAGLARADAATREAKTAARINDVTTLGPAAMAAVRGPGMVAAGATAAVRQRAIEMMARVQVEGYSAAARMLGAADAFAHLHRWPTPPPPTLVLVGAEDATTPPPDVLRIAHAIRGARYQEIAAAAHAAYLEQPETYCAAVLEFLTR